MGAAAGAIVGSLGGVVGTVLQVASSKKTEKEMKKAAKQRDAAQQRMISDLQAKEAQAQGMKTSAALRARTAAMGSASLGSNTRSTILTGPSGLSAQAPGEIGERKTLLGV